MNAVAELIDVEFPLQFKSGGGCSNVDTDVRVDIWRNQCSKGGVQMWTWISEASVGSCRNWSLRYRGC